MDLDRVHTVLVRPLQPGNVGSAARALANHGLRHLTLVNPPAFDPDRARWMAPGSHDWIDGARFTSTVEEAVAGSSIVVGTSGRKRRWDWPIWSLSELIDQMVSSTGQVHVLFGPEDRGLANEELHLCHAILRLETAEHASLNLSQAVAVVTRAVFQAALDAGTAPEMAMRQGRRGGPRTETVAPPEVPSSPATQEFQEAVVTQALKVLESSGYFVGRTPSQVHGTLYRLLHRAGPTQLETSALMGMLKAVDWKIKAESED